MPKRLIRHVVAAKTAAAAIAQSLVTNGVTLTLGIATSVLAARLLGPEGRGESAALVALPAFASFVASAGMGPAIVHVGSTRGDERSSLERLLPAIALILGVTAAVFAARSSATLPRSLGDAVTHWAPVLCLFSVTGVYANLANSLLLSRQDFSTSNLIRILQPIFALAGLLLLWWKRGSSPLEVALVTMTSGLPGLALAVWKLRPRSSGVHVEIPETIRRLWSYAIRAWPSDVLAMVSFQVDKLITILLLRPHEIGLFTVAFGLSRLVAVVPNAVSSVVFPKVAGLDSGQVHATVIRSAAITLVFVAGLVLMLWIFAPFVLALLYSDAFAAGSGMFRLLVLEAALTAMHGVLAQTFLALDSPGAVGWQHGSGLALSIILAAILAPVFGGSGVALALLGGAALRLSLVLALYPLRLGLPVPRILPAVTASFRMLAERIRGGTL